MNITEEIVKIVDEKSPMFEPSPGRRIRALTALYFKSFLDMRTGDMHRLVLAIEMIGTSLAINEDDFK